VTSREACIALNMIDGLGPVTVRALTERLGSPEAVFTCVATDLRGIPNIGPERAAKILAQRDALDPAAEEAHARKLGARLVTPEDADYPPALRTIHDPPLALYVRGALTDADRQAMAVVGSRRCSQYGRSSADRLSFQLARMGFTIVSGLARGIDASAHEGALKAGGRTLAVLGSALDRLYPPENAPLADRIAEQGAVISEYPLGREPDRTTFPYRNRILSGLSMGVLVVECDLRSGAMHTARFAGEHGRPLFAVPGRIDSALSRGPHSLIRTGAKLVEDVKDVVEEFEYLWPRLTERAQAQAAETPPPRIQLNDEEQAVATALLEGAMDADSLARRAGLTAARLNVVLVGLEMKRVVRLRPGRQVELAVPAERAGAAPE
jgi:DNA processing protein